MNFNVFLQMATMPEFNAFMDTELGLCKKGIQLCDIECVDLLIHYIRNGAEKSPDTAGIANEKFRLLSDIIRDKSGLTETFPDVLFFTGEVTTVEPKKYIGLQNNLAPSDLEKKKKEWETTVASKIEIAQKEKIMATRYVVADSSDVQHNKKKDTTPYDCPSAENDKNIETTTWDFSNAQNDINIDTSHNDHAFNRKKRRSGKRGGCVLL